jgi:glutaredoxin 3
MPKIEIYTSNNCPYCVKAKKLFEIKGWSYHEINVSNDSTQREVMMVRSQGGRSVPQIFINDTHIGGCDDLYALDAEGKLDHL